MAVMDKSNILSLKEKIDVEKFIRDHLDRVSGSPPQITARCPGHADNRNSLSINTDTGQWTCHAGCGPEFRRDIINLIQLIHGTSFGDALAYLKEYIEEGNIKRAAIPGDSFPKELEDKNFIADESFLVACQERLFINDKWKKFITDRKIHQKIVLEFRIGVDNNNNLVIPAINIDGEIKGLRFRAEDGSRWWAEHSKPSQILYGKFVPNSDTVFITEGETDALALLSHLRQSPFSITGIFGASIAWRKEWTDLLLSKGIKKFIIGGDHDRAGRNMNKEIANTLMSHGIDVENIKVVNWDSVARVAKHDLPEKYDIGQMLVDNINILENIDKIVKPFPNPATLAVQAVATSNQENQRISHKDPKIELPDSAWPPIMAEMRDALHVRIPSPDAIIMGGLLATISHIVGRRAAVMVFGRHIPALYNLSIADTNIGKSAMLDYMSEQLFPFLGGMLNGTGTTISTYGFFGSAEGVGKAFSEVADNRILQLADEYSTQLMKAKSEGGGPVIQAILSLWQGSAQGSIAKSGGWDLTGKHLSIAAATTKIYLHSYMRREDVMGGYANRFCYWLGFKYQTRNVLFPENPDPKIVREFCQVLMEMSNLLGPHAAQPQVEVYPTKEAKGLASEWFEGFKNNLASMDEMQTLICSRIPSQIARIAAIFALIDHSTQVTATQMRRAIEVGNYLMDSTWFAFHDYGMSGRTACAVHIIQKIEEAGGKLNKRALQQHIPARFRDEFSGAISDLQRQGLLLEESSGRKKFWTLSEVGE